MAAEPLNVERRRRLLLVDVVAVLIVGWAIWSAATAVAVAHDADAGRKAVERARRHASPAEIVDGKPLPELRAARTRFRRAHARIRNPLLTPARILPIVGRQIRSADALTGAATTVTEVAISAIEEGRGILNAPRDSGSARVSLLRRTAALARDADQRIGRASLGPSKGLIGPLRRGRRQFGSQITELRTTLRNAALAAGAAADLLEGPRRTLVFAANNAEMRAGSGTFLQVGELATAGGRISLGKMNTVLSVDVPRGIPVTGDMAARWGWANPSRTFTSLMLSPEFDESAELAAQMWRGATGRSVDGVIAIDPVGLRALIRATGPVSVRGVRYDAGNVVRELLHGQYARVPPSEVGTIRRERLGDIAAAVMRKLDGGKWDPATLMSGLADAARGRHVILWSSHPDEQKAWHIAGADGRLPASSLMVSLLNRGANKLDYFMRVETVLSFVPKGSGSEGVLRVTVRNTAGRSEPPYIQGGTIAPPGTYVGILAVTLPGSSGGGRIDGVPRLGVVGPDGPTRVVGVLFQLARGKTRTFVIRFELAETAGTLRVAPSARVPAVHWHFGTDDWEDSEPRTVSWGEKSRGSR